ncbi:hypothetical protein Glove_9g277 [Diversispora epigaea]|uniref:VWFA domain-containing protein n=1 Tax=Diversispora epigaea TaxID=1348612 RepID=A0A397JNT9_9GLOM|nr:hypothetical protein Glove_9g277 [Diversispora epigaea]
MSNLNSDNDPLDSTDSQFTDDNGFQKNPEDPDSQFTEDFGNNEDSDSQFTENFGNNDDNGFQKNPEDLENNEETEENLQNDRIESDSETQTHDTYYEDNEDNREDIDDDIQDLCKIIPGFYRLLDLYKDDGTNGLVDKIIISESDVKKLCNDMIPGSFKTISKINYKKLNSFPIHLIGIYGRNSLIAKLLLDKGIVDDKTYKLLLMPYRDNSGIRPTAELKPGIYLLRLPSDEIDEKNKFLVIHWSEDGCYEDKVSSFCRKNMTNFHRHLTKITEHQICLMDDYDLENIDWKRYESNESEDEIVEDNDIFVDFEVKKSEEQKENFEIFPGFEVYFSKLTPRSRPTGDHYEGIPLYPLIVESASNPILLTREIIPENTATKTVDENYDSTQLLNYFKTKLEIQQYALKINQSITMEKLEIIVKYGLKELNGTVYSDLLDLFEKSSKKGLTKIDKFANKLLYENYSGFETKYYEGEKSTGRKSNPAKIEDISIKSSKIREMIQAVVDNIDHCDWIDLKERYIFAQKHGKSLNLKENDTQIINSGIEEVFQDKEKDLFNLVKKCTGKKDSVDKIISEIEETRKISDKEFVHSICNEKILNEFFEMYKRWREYVLPLKSKQVICDYIEELHPSKISLHINDIEKVSFFGIKSFKMASEIKEQHPAKLSISLHEIQLDQSDKLEMEKDENFIPKPILHGKNSFEILIETYDFKQIARFNKKYLVFLWNKTNTRLELYFGDIKNISTALCKQNAVKKLYFEHSDHFMVAVNEPKGLIAIYDTVKGSLNIYSFNQEQTEIYLQYKNILLQQWYNNNIPEIAHFFFIKNTEDICFVEKNRQARIYNSNNASFQSGEVQLPINTNHILSTPDGTCFVAFTKERTLNSNASTTDPAVTDSATDPKMNPTTNIATDPTTELAANLATDSTIEPKIDSTTEPAENLATDFTNDPTINPTTELAADLAADSTKELATDSTTESGDIINEINENLIKAHVYFCENFTENAIKIIDIPFSNSPIDLFRFSLFDSRQIHLTTIDQQNGNFQSILVKITHTRTKYRFEQQHSLKSVEQVRFEDAHPFLVFGENTKFTRYIQKGDFLIIGNEKRVISEIESDFKLKIDKLFETIEPEKFYDFRIESRSSLNDLLDVYSLVFTKYAINSPIGKIDKPLTVYIALNLKNHKIDDYSEKISEYFVGMWKKFEEVTKKPLGHIKNFKTSVIPYQHDNIDELLSENLLGEWLIDFFCLTPIQIAITQDNKFIPLRDGLVFKGIDESTGSVSETISFGWYESIFDYYSNLELKVISSMGEQSCGKSYLLNHCLGTTFDGSAMRCTEGVWMSLVKTSKILYVALDFEGLASIERSAQEETFLQLLNAALSDLVLFKSQFSISRDVTSMFRRFKDGAAWFCIVIKDVAERDRTGIVEEFRSKFSKIVEKDEEDNFISKLYRNKMTIIPYPLFSESDFYTKLKGFKAKLDKQETSYKNARMFVEKIKVIMTNLKNCKWGSIDATLLTMRAYELKKFMNNAISFGFEQKEEDPFQELNKLDDEQEQNIKNLTNRDDGLLITDDEILVSEIFDHVNNSVKLMPDTGLELLGDQKNFVQISSDIIKFSETNIYSRRSILESEWVDHLKAFFKFIINRRISRVNEWFSKNISRFPKDHNEIVINNYALEQEITNLNSFWNLCCIQCDKCGLKCLKSSRHSDNGDEGHSCLTDHRCHKPCNLKEAHVDEVLPECNNYANHEGKHRCSQKDHTCGAPCIYHGKRNCQSICAKDIGHGDTQNDEIHLCEATRHYCGEPCSLKTETKKGPYQCKNTCIIPCEEKHELHECQNEVCPIECPLENCRQKCESSNHFHSDEKDVNHFCGQEHQCQKDCEEEGICKIVTKPTSVETKYENAHDSFMFTKYSQTFQRLPCCVKIPPYKFEHDGKHVHEIKKPHLCDSNCPNDKGQHIKEEENKQNFHFCDIKCPNCSYYCTLPYGHGEMHNSKHSTTHGNMFLTTFTCEDNEFEFKGRRLNSGDGGDFVLCHKLCEGIGRHRHIDYCRDPEACKNIGKKEGLHEHINANIEPNPQIAKDYVSHQVFWEKTNFRDPYSKDDREEFKKCDHECPDEKHHKIDENSGQQPIKSYCTQKMFHSSLDPNSDLPNGIGYISIDGHHFTCDNPTTSFHIIFVVDKSGSMSSVDCKPEFSDTKLECLKDAHNNRLGAVYEAVYRFITKTKNFRRDMDTNSLILFDNGAQVAYENESLSNPDALLEKMVKYGPTGGTSFKNGIKKAAEMIDPSKTNVVIFLSDGEDRTPESELRTLCQKEKDKGSYLYLYTIKFADVANTTSVRLFRLVGRNANYSRDQGSLSEMAKIAKEYLPNNRDSLKCEYVRAIDQIDLVTHFYKVAESLRNHKPTLISVNKE